MTRRAVSWLRRHKTAIAFAVLALGVIVSMARLELYANTNRDVLCALEADIERRRDAAQTYLDEHPRGVVSPKTNAIIISAAELQRSIDSQTSTLAALDRGGLHC